MQPDIFYHRHYSPAPSSYCSSAVSTPSIAPTPGMFQESMLAHQPAFLIHAQPKMNGAILSHILQLQQQTHALIQSLVQPQEQPVYAPQFVQTRGYYSPAPTPPQVPPASSDPYLVAQQILGSGPIDESSIARAVVVVAGVIAAKQSGSMSGLRAAPPPTMHMPQAMRSQTPAWLHQAAQQPESPSNTAESPLAEVVMSLSNREELRSDGIDQTPGFGGKSPGTVMKCRSCDDN